MQTNDTNKNSRAESAKCLNKAQQLLFSTILVNLEKEGITGLKLIELN